jgi:MoaD family protein
MQIRFFATIRECTGTAELQYHEGAATLRELLEKLSATYGLPFRRYVFDHDEINAAVLIVINGRDARESGGPNTRLNSTDCIAIFPALAGGITSAAEQVQLERL